MSARVRPRRSVLYMPGSNARALEKAKGLPADALILDLEDAVAPQAKASAREQVCAERTIVPGGSLVSSSPHRRNCRQSTMNDWVSTFPGGGLSGG